MYHYDREQEKKLHTAFKVQYVNNNPEIQDDITPFVWGIPTMDGKIKKEGRYSPEDIIMVELIPSYRLARSLEVKPNLLLYAKADHIRSASAMRASIAEEWQLTNKDSKEPKITQLAFARNKLDFQNYRSLYEAQFRGETIGPKTLEDDVFSKTIRYLQENESERERFSYIHVDLVFDRNLLKTFPNQIVTETNHPAEILVKICPQLQGLEYIGLVLIYFHTLPQYGKYIELAETQELAMEIDRIKYETNGLISPHTIQQKEMAQKSISESSCLVMYSLKIIGVLLKGKEDKIMQQILSMYKDYPLRKIGLSAYRKKGIPVSKVIEADKMRASMVTSQMTSAMNVAKLMMPFGTNMLDSDDTEIKSLRGDKIPEKPIGTGGHIVLGKDPNTGKPLTVERKVLTPGVGFVGVPGGGKSTAEFNTMNQLLMDPTQAAIILSLHHSGGQLISNIPRIRHENIVYINYISQKPIGIKILDTDPAKQEYSISNLKAMAHADATKNKSEARGYGHNMDDYFENGVPGLLCPTFNNPTLAHVKELTNKDFLSKTLKYTTVERSIKYFNGPYAELVSKGRAPGLSVSTILTPFISPLTCQLNPKLDITEAINNKRIIILDLNKWALGVEKTISTAIVFILKVMTELLSPERSNDPNKLVHLFLDEAHLYLVDEIAEIAISQGRNKGARFYFTYQSRTQYGEKLRNAVEALNSIVFKCSAEESDYWHKEVQTEVRNLTNLPPYRYYLRLHEKVYFLEGLKPVEAVDEKVVREIQNRSEEEFGGTIPDLNSKEYFDSIFPKSRRRKKDITA
ncbi:hypothetical protein GF312_10825 [Candidatus Poribacteria bacterium]|nr:hypothetical protein [Candidatus Poribacteria bacterium]